MSTPAAPAPSARKVLIDSYRRFSASVPEGLRFSLSLFFTARLPWLLLGTLSLGLLPLGDGARRMQPLDGPAWTNLWLRWDSGWYVRIIQEGYTASRCIKPTDPCAESSIAFLPLYPMSVRLLTQVGLPLGLSSFLLNGVCLVVAMWAMHRLAKRFASDDDFPQRAMWAMLIFPTTLFFSAGYAEALYAALSMWGVVFLLENRLVWATLLLAAGTLTRPHGAVLVGCLVLGQLARRRWRPAATVAVGSALVFGAYLAWQYHAFGDALAYFHGRLAWGFGGKALDTVQNYLGALKGDAVAKLTCLLDFLCAALLLVVSVHAARRYSAELGSYCFLLIAMSLSYGQVWSMSRGVLGAFPVFLALADWTAKPWFKGLALMLGLGWGTINMVLFINGQWVS